MHKERELRLGADYYLEIVNGKEIKIPILGKFLGGASMEKPMKRRFPEWHQYMYEIFSWIPEWKDKIRKFRQFQNDNVIYKEIEVDGRIIKSIDFGKTSYLYFGEQQVKERTPEFYEWLCEKYKHVNSWTDKLKLYRKCIDESEIIDSVEIDGKIIAYPKFNNRSTERYSELRFPEFYELLSNTYSNYPLWKDKIKFFKRDYLNWYPSEKKNLGGKLISVPIFDKLKRGQTSEKHIKHIWPEFYEYLMVAYPNVIFWMDKLNLFRKMLPESWFVEVKEGIPVPNYKNLSNSQHNELFTKRHFPLFYQFIFERYPNTPKWSSKLKLYLADKDEIIKEFTIQELGEKLIKVPSSKLSTRQLQSNNLIRCFPEFCEYINLQYSHIDKWMERLYMFYNGLTERPKCLVCGKDCIFKDFVQGYSLYCCEKCAANSQEIKDKLKKYRESLTEEEKRRIVTKQLNTYYKKIMEQHPDILGIIIKDNKVYFRCVCPRPDDNDRLVACKECKLKEYIVETSLYWGRLRDNSEPCTNITIFSGIYKRNPNVIEVIKKDGKTFYRCLCPHPDFNNEICTNCKLREYIVESTVFNQRKRNDTEPCIILKPIGHRDHSHSISEIELIFMKFLDICKIEYEPFVRGIIKSEKDIPKEIDFLLRQYGLAIEINGMYTHSLIKKEWWYHEDKRKQCNAHNLELICLWEEWIKNDFEAVAEFLFTKIVGGDVTKFKLRWFPGLSENEWPLDLGKPSTPIKKIVSHHYLHGKYECYDSGIAII